MLSYSIFPLLLMAVAGQAFSQELAAPRAADAAPPATSVAQERPMYVSGEAVMWATPKAVVPPVYPKAMLDSGKTGVVDLVVQLRETGKVQSIIEVKAENGQEDLEFAVVRVLDEWRFSMPLDAECKPYATTARLRVWFELKEGKPSISVSHREPPRARNLKRVVMTNQKSIASRLSKAYPYDARAEVIIADVFTRLSVDPVTGKTTSVKVVGLVGNNALASRDGKLWTGKGDGMPPLGKEFIAATERSFASAEFVPIPGETDPVTVCKVVGFRLTEPD